MIQLGFTPGYDHERTRADIHKLTSMLFKPETAEPVQDAAPAQQTGMFDDLIEEVHATEAPAPQVVDAEVAEVARHNDAPAAPVAVTSAKKIGPSSNRAEMFPNGEIALARVRAGFLVTPLGVDDGSDNAKKPFMLSWPKCPYGPHNKKALRERWSESNYNVGWVMGPQPSGRHLVAIDVDVKDGARGAQSLATLELLGLPTDGLQTRTPSGGTHLIFWTDRPLGSPRGIMPGIDIRCEGGQVVAPGSTINGKAYAKIDGDIPELPDWMADIIEQGVKAHHKPEDRSPLVEWDKPENISQAIDYLTNSAPEAIEGQGGNNTTYQVIARVKDFGISPDECDALMLEHYNEVKAIPPWTLEELETIRRSAYKNGTLPPGIAVATDDLGDVQKELDALSAEEHATSLKAVADWDDPMDLWSDESAPPDLAGGVLPTALERWVRDETKRLGVSYGAGAVAAVVACATALSSAFRVQPKQHNSGHTEAPILWGAIVGPPGARKSPLLAAFMRPIEQIERELSKLNQDARKKYEADHQEWKRRVKNGETLPEPEKPKARRKLVQDTTTEALAEILAANPDGVLCHLDELAQWAGNMDSYRHGKSTSRDQPFWLQAKNGGHYRADRVTRDPVHIEVTAVHVLGGIQPDVIRKLAPEWGGNGMLQRFLLAIMGQANQELDAEPDAEAQQAIYGALRRLHELRPSEFLDTFKFEPEAEAVRKRLVEFRDATIASGVPVPLEGWLSKLEGEWARLSLVFHAIEWSANTGRKDPFEGPPEMISAETAERAARFLLEFQYPHQVAFYRNVAGIMAGADDEARRIAGHMLAHPKKTLGERDMWRACNSLRGAQKRLQRLDVAQTLEMHGWLRPTGRINRDGGHNDQWKVNPKIYDGRFERRIATERAARAAQQASIKASADARRRTQETPEWAD
jgi:hypothetical protein